MSHRFLRFLKIKVSSVNSKNMAQFCYLQLYLGIKIVSCRLDGHGLKLAVVGPLQSLML